MAHKFVVLGKKIKGGFQLIASPDIDPSKQKKIVSDNSENGQFSEVQMFRLEPHTRSYFPKQKSENNNKETPSA